MNRHFLLISFLGFLIFIGMSILFIKGYTSTIDLFFTPLLNIESPLIINIMQVITEVGSVEAILLFSIVILIYLLLIRKKYLFWFFSILSAGGVLLNLTLKLIFQRERPGDATVIIETFGQSIGLISYSFPSGHTMRSFLLFAFLLFLSNKVSNRYIQKFLYFTSVFFLITIPLSRIILDSHFPTDIIAAIAVSIFWFFLTLYILSKFSKNSSKVSAM
ncbi:phosphatase PAP2 family protein [Anaerobacillus isosaccharinicus]|uniref:Phosphatidic acid phosphatase type 2/haloperoxidase domain-containing protein n=2 Tax=Anaerobacillus isosaccharinicus TaxID=1532552 RepID=A0A1S2KY78_9BACI